MSFYIVNCVTVFYIDVIIMYNNSQERLSGLPAMSIHRSYPLAITVVILARY